MNRRLVEIRSADADENLRRIKKSLEKATGRRKGAEELTEKLDKLSYGDASISAIDGLIRFCNNIVDRLETVWPGLQLLPKITAAEQGLIELEKKHKALLAAARELTKSYAQKQLGFHDVWIGDLIKGKRGELDMIRAEARLPDKSSNDLLKSIEAAKPLWGEHIETVAGMVLRDDRFDEGLCVLADQLVRICSGSTPLDTPKTLNILGRDRTILKDLAYTIYFRFPTWSVWGLPLIAHEFWHASFASRKDLYRYFEKKVDKLKTVWDEPLIQKCLADIFATYVIGPAYAFACVLLILNAESPLDRIRARVVFATLDHLAQKEDAIDQNEAKKWYGFLPELKSDWNEASQPESAADTPCLLLHQDYSCHLVGELIKIAAQSTPPQEQAAAERALSAELKNIRCKLAGDHGVCRMKDSTLIDSMQKVLLEFLGLAAGDLRYPLDPWSGSGESLIDRLTAKKSEQPGDKSAVPGQFFKEEDLRRWKTDRIDLRHVLHATWSKRWRTSDPDSKRIEAIAERARQLCEELVDELPEGDTAADRNGA